MPDNFSLGVLFHFCHRDEAILPFLMSLLKSIVVFTTALSSGVILSCWQFFAIVLNSVRYDAMLSQGSWLRFLNR